MVVLLLLLVVVHGASSAALVRRYRHCILDCAVSFLRIENIRIVDPIETNTAGSRRAIELSGTGAEFIQTAGLLLRRSGFAVLFS